MRRRRFGGSWASNSGGAHRRGTKPIPAAMVGRNRADVWLDVGRGEERCPVLPARKLDDSLLSAISEFKQDVWMERMNSV